jgi:hypothetical protein
MSRSGRSFKMVFRIDVSLATFSIIDKYAKLNLGSENTLPPVCMFIM